CFVIRHLPGCFAVMGLPQEIKTDNGPRYVARGTQDFLAHCGVKHSTGIPGNSTGQASIERTYQV
ncbi:POK18 protein, partial [Sylvia borin]|nr:POK18 protein [Sylvia borin]